MARCLPRYLGPVESLPAGMWTADGDRPSVRCAECGGIDVLDVVDDNVAVGSGQYAIGATGVVVPEYRCETVTCGKRQWLVVEGFGDP